MSLILIDQKGGKGRGAELREEKTQAPIYLETKVKKMGGNASSKGKSGESRR